MDEKLSNLIREAVKNAFDLYDNADNMANYVVHYVASGIAQTKEGEHKKMIYGGEATLEDLCRLNQLGFEFVVEDGMITHVLQKAGE